MTNAIHSSYKDGLYAHCEIAALLIDRYGPDLNPHVNHNILSAIREASKKVTPYLGSNVKLRAEYMSVNAEKSITSRKPSALAADHAVPVSVINGEVLRLNKPLTQAIVDVVTRFSRLVNITEDEHRALRDNGLTKSMPRGWTYDASDDETLHARYRATDIAIVKKRWSEAGR
jgi:hypothetical protein